MLFQSCLYQLHKYIKKNKEEKEKKRKNSSLKACSRRPSPHCSYDYFSWATSFPLCWAQIIPLNLTSLLENRPKVLAKGTSYCCNRY